MEESLKKKKATDSDSLSISEKAKVLKANIDEIEEKIRNPRARFRSEKKKSPRKEAIKAKIFRNQKI